MFSKHGKTIIVHLPRNVYSYCFAVESLQTNYLADVLSRQCVIYVATSTFISLWAQAIETGATAGGRLSLG